MARLVVAFLVMATSLVLGVSPALAQPSAATTAAASSSERAASADGDVDALERSLTLDHEALSTTDCTAACRALSSIRRAADKICALEPGPRCAKARAKADDATKRVREACPACAVAFAAPTEPDAPRATDSEILAKTASAGPPAESKRGGCAGCTTARGAPADLATTALLALWVLGGLRRRRRRP